MQLHSNWCIVNVRAQEAILVCYTYYVIQNLNTENTKHIIHRYTALSKCEVTLVCYTQRTATQVWFIYTVYSHSGA